MRFLCQQRRCRQFTAADPRGHDWYQSLRRLPARGHQVRHHGAGGRHVVQEQCLGPAGQPGQRDGTTEVPRARSRGQRADRCQLLAHRLGLRQQLLAKRRLFRDRRAGRQILRRRLSAGTRSLSLAATEGTGRNSQGDSARIGRRLLCAGHRQQRLPPHQLPEDRRPGRAGGRRHAEQKVRRSSPTPRAAACWPRSTNSAPSSAPPTAF